MRASRFSDLVDTRLELADDVPISGAGTRKFPPVDLTATNPYWADQVRLGRAKVLAAVTNRSADGEATLSVVVANNIALEAESESHPTRRVWQIDVPLPPSMPDTAFDVPIDLDGALLTNSGPLFVGVQVTCDEDASLFLGGAWLMRLAS